MQKIVIQLETLTCPSCAQKIENAVKSDGVERESVNVLFNSSKVKLDFDSGKVSPEQIAKAITALGCKGSSKPRLKTDKLQKLIYACTL